MKKLLAILLLLAIVVTFASYILIPNSKLAIETTSISTNYNAVFRALSEPETLSRLIKSKTAAISPGISAFEYNDVNMRFQERMNATIEVSMEKEGKIAKSVIMVTPKGDESTLVEWRMRLSQSYNPFKRIQQYIQTKAIKTDMADFLKKLETFAVHNENIYGFDIERARLTDSLLITTKSVSTTIPSTETYYSMIKQLQAYAKNQNALVTNYPMLNITTINRTQYETTVALPINKVVPDKDAIVFKRMVPGKILIAETKGGLLTVNKGFSQISNYISDRGLVTPAIPFQSLITDRMVNKDSSQWITKLYYPIL
ncbi:MAG TPA: hypothetical protein VD794_05175 [Flavisolibacter sp.]|nr:hypothetical protein [Flavisolibacter sp.]